jgi:aminoglycoside phosphotransferase (APT) family kinase protein
MIGDDLVHLDFHPGNVLVDDGRITGVIDWDGATRGDRHLDLVNLRFMLAATAPHLVGMVDERLTLISAGRRERYWAHHALRAVDWAIRHHDAAAVDRWLTVAESG